MSTSGRTRTSAVNFFHVAWLRRSSSEIPSNSARLLCAVTPSHAIGNDERPQTHKHANGWIHREKVAKDHLPQLAPNPHLRAPAEVGAQDRCDERSGTILKLAPWADAKGLQIGLTDA